MVFNKSFIRGTKVNIYVSASRKKKTHALGENGSDKRKRLHAR